MVGDILLSKSHFPCTRTQIDLWDDDSLLTSYKDLQFYHHYPHNSRAYIIRSLSSRLSCIDRGQSPDKDLYPLLLQATTVAQAVFGLNHVQSVSEIKKIAVYEVPGEVTVAVSHDGSCDGKH